MTGVFEIAQLPSLLIFDGVFPAHSDDERYQLDAEETQNFTANSTIDIQENIYEHLATIMTWKGHFWTVISHDGQLWFAGLHRDQKFLKLSQNLPPFVTRQRMFNRSSQAIAHFYGITSASSPDKDELRGKNGDDANKTIDGEDSEEDEDMDPDREGYVPPLDKETGSEGESERVDREALTVRAISKSLKRKRDDGEKNKRKKRHHRSEEIEKTESNRKRKEKGKKKRSHKAKD